MKENKNTHVIALRAAAVLLILVLFTTSIVSGRYARYSTSASGSDNARIAVMAAGVTSITLDTITGCPTTTYSVAQPIKICNYATVNGKERVSEVSLRIKLEAATVMNNIPLTFAFFKDAACQTAVSDADLLFAPGEKDEKTFYLQISWPKVAVESYAFEIDAIRVVATAEQID